MSDLKCKQCGGSGIDPDKLLTRTEKIVWVIVTFVILMGLVYLTRPS